MDEAGLVPGVTFAGTLEVALNNTGVDRDLPLDAGGTTLVRSGRVGACATGSETDSRRTLAAMRSCCPPRPRAAPWVGSTGCHSVTGLRR